MNSAEMVSNLIADEKKKGIDLQTVAWDAALACVGWSYVFGARWQYCTPAVRRSRYSDEHPTIKTKCKNFNGSSSAGCKGCQWYPDEKLTRCNDCRGFTYGILNAVYGLELIGAGATSQWNTASNWSAKGEISTMPADTLVCLFVHKDGKMSHTGFGLNDQTIECSNGVQHFKTRNKKWTHWAVPVCVSADPVPTPEGCAKVTGKRVALRKAPATAAGEIITRVNTGETVKLLDPPPLGWVYVEYGKKKGWMMKKYIDEG